ncbi:uncharacterized protein LOC132200102 isoform X2 [Neocloeon triangulifer]|uniref:uncharacterized protein LOC132200102 isoform X2 n=1 Tax=Neocloeon triangulifer TaxID=2078957 RepID=UPI00286F2472|nr:uncharacterized protein LOC132200102 isoform X2 [Neocloeon triangulifer]
MSSQNYDCVCMMHLKAFQMYYPEKFDSLKFAKIISPVWRNRVSHYKNYGTQIRYNNVISDFPWVNFKESSEGIDQEPNKNGLLKKLLMTSTGDQDVNLYSLLEVSAPEYLDPFYYDGRCSVMHGGKDAKIDLIHATMTGTRLVFDHETTGLDFWKSIKSNTECNNCSDDPDMLCKGMFIKECHALLSYECNERKSLKYSDKYHPEDFLFCKGVLWQLHVNPAMLNQWLMAALHVIMQFEKQTSMLRYMPVPLQMEEVVKELLVFLRDLRKRISYGFLLIGYQVKIHPEKDKQVNMLIREDIVPQSLASLKLLLNDEKIQNFILKLPHAILAARKKGTFGKDVYMNAKNFTVSDEVDKFDNIFSFKFWTGARENLFGTLKTEIDDLKSKINKSETHASVENVLLIEESNDDVLDALKMHFPDPVCSKANIDKLNKDLCTDQSRLYTKSCLFSLLLEEHRTIVSHLFAKCLTDEDYLHFKMTETELNEFINLKQGFEGQKLLDIARDKYIEEWDGKRFPVDILYIRESPSNPREGILQELRSQILMDVDETSELYPSWGFVFNILPFLNLSLSKCGDGGLKDKFTDACGKALVKVFRGDRVAWKLHPEDAMENSKWFINSLLQPKKVLLPCNWPSHTHGTASPVLRPRDILHLEFASAILNREITREFLKSFSRNGT